MKQTIITAMLALVAHCAFAVAPDSLKKDLEDYDYLVSFVEKNYAPFDAIMQKGYKREYKALKKQVRGQLRKRESNLYKKNFSEGQGIVSDVIIPLPFARKLTDNIDEWVLWVAEDLKNLP